MKKLLSILVISLLFGGNAYSESIHFKCAPLEVFGQKKHDYDPELSINLKNKTLSLHIGNVPIHYVGERKIKAKDSYAEYEFDRILGHFTETVLDKLPSDEYIRKWKCEIAKSIF